MKNKYKRGMMIAVLFAAAAAAFAQADAATDAALVARALGGVAKAAGDTVTLSGKAALTKALTVPEGVTLDLTAKGAVFELQGGAKLTVNATGHGDRGKGWVEGSLRIYGTSVIDGSGTINLKSKGELLNIHGGGGKRKLTLDGVTLVGVKDNDEPPVFVHEGGAFVMKSGAITGNTWIGGDWAGGGGVHIGTGTFTMEGGRIHGRTASDGFAANIAQDGAALNMYDSTAKWGKGGAYTKGGIPQTGGSDIGRTNDTLIAIPK